MPTPAFVQLTDEWIEATLARRPGVATHEAYPGHYVHISWLHNAERRLPHFLMTTTTAEGWAPYVEQVMIETAFASGKPACVNVIIDQKPEGSRAATSSWRP